jgi:hypothetical protein
MASGRLIRIICVLGCGIGVCLGQEASPQRVNLGRLSIASVFSTQTEPDDPVCDIRNLFDGASQSSCLVAGNSVEVRFTSPVLVSQIRLVVAPAAAGTPQPSYPTLKFAVSLAASGSRENFNSPVIVVSGARIAYNLPRPLTAGQATIRFGMLRRPADIQEIEILGVPPDGTSLAPVTPPIDLARSVHETEHAKSTKRSTQESDKPRPY